jgi:hypothetical protein
MSTHTAPALPEEIRQQVTRLGPDSRNLVDVFAGDCLLSLESVRRVKLGQADRKEWPSAKRRLSDALDRLGGFASVPPPLRHIVTYQPPSSPDEVAIWDAEVVHVCDLAKPFLMALQQAAAGEAAIRPPNPTKEYCLFEGYRVRWDGEPDVTELAPLLWHILDFLLSRKRYPFPLGDLEDAIWGKGTVTGKTVVNALSRLSKALLPIRFPWEWRVRSAHVYREG